MVRRFAYAILTIVMVYSVRAGAENRWAVLVGIDDYASDSITPLDGAVGDAEALRDVLMAYGRFDRERVFCLTSDDAANVPDLGNIITKLEYVAHRAEADDVFVFFFSGHGVMLDGEGFLLTQESDTRSPMLLKRKSLPVSELVGLLGDIHKSDTLKLIKGCG